MDNSTNPASRAAEITSLLKPLSRDQQIELDDMVLDVALDIAFDERHGDPIDDGEEHASQINNQGPEAQIAFLLQNGADADELQRELTALNADVSAGPQP